MKKLLRRMLRAAAAAPLAMGLLTLPVAANSPQDDDDDVVEGASTGDAEPRADSSHWDFELDFGFSGAIGNSDYAIVTSGFDVQYTRPSRYEVAWSGSLRYGEGDEGVIERALKASMSFALAPKSRWSPFIYTKIERDVFRRVGVRTNMGAGVNYDLIDAPKAAVSLSATLLHDYKGFTNPSDDPTPLATQSSARWSLRAKSRRSLGGGADLDNTTWLKAVPGAPGDYDLDSTTKVTVPLSEHVGLKITHTLKRDSTPPPEVDKNDQLLQVGVTVGF